MANPEHVEILKQGVEVWNQWREENDQVLPDIRDTDLQYMNLEGINLNKGNLSGANLRKTKLRKADLHDANLNKATSAGQI